jgi:predicted metal-dependent phosphoesterase TrpH
MINKSKNELKIDLHIHAKEDKIDKISYTAKQLIDKASKLKYDVLSFTFHKKLFWQKEIIKYAKQKGILLIPGVEMSIEGKDVLVYNIKQKEVEKIKTLNDLQKIKDKNKNIFVIAPHPYYMTKVCLGEKLEKSIKLFDAIEHSWFFSNKINPNKKAIKISRRYNKPIIATSDCHHISYFGSSYAVIESKKDINSIFKAIKKNKIINHVKPLSFISLNLYATKIILNKLLK